MDSDLDSNMESLLTGEMLEAPKDFTQRIMQRIYLLPISSRHSGLLEKFQKLALIAGGVLGAAQLTAFMFGLWAASAAG